MLQSKVPVFDTITSSPKLLNFFIVVIVSLSVSLLVTSFTSYLYHVPANEAKNFSEFHARFSRSIARFFNFISCGYWVIDVPEEMNQIAANDGPEELNQLIYDVDGIKLLVIRNKEVKQPENLIEFRIKGFQFFADMLNRLTFFIIMTVLFVAFMFFIVECWFAHSFEMNELNKLKLLSNQNKVYC